MVVGGGDGVLGMVMWEVEVQVWGGGDGDLGGADAECG